MFSFDSLFNPILIVVVLALLLFSGMLPGDLSGILPAA